MLTISQQLVDEMIAHARATAPEEACGLLAGRGSAVRRLYRITNDDHSPTRYFMNPRELLRTFKDMRNEALEHLAIYHSHTHTAAYPSATDVRLAYYPDVVYLIVSLQDQERSQLKGYRIQEGRITEEPFAILP